MSHDVKMFFLLYLLSGIPMSLAMMTSDKTKTIGLAIIDMALTIAAYIFLWQAIGWWTMLVLAIGIGVGYVLRGFGFEPYKSLSSR